MEVKLCGACFDQDGDGNVILLHKYIARVKLNYDGGFWDEEINVIKFRQRSSFYSEFKNLPSIEKMIQTCFQFTCDFVMVEPR